MKVEIHEQITMLGQRCTNVVYATVIKWYLMSKLRCWTNVVQTLYMQL